jgi:putative membrane protein
MIRRLLAIWLITAIALAITTWIVSGIEINGGVGSLLIVAAIFGLVNTILGPIARFLTFPIIIVTLGLFAWVINALLLLLTDWLTDRLEIDGFWPAMWGALVISVVLAISDWILTPRSRTRR